MKNAVEQPILESQVVPLKFNREYLILTSGQAVSNLGSQVSVLAFSVLTFSLTGSLFQTGLVSTFSSLPYLFFGLPAGAMVDRWDRRRMMIYCDALRFLVLGSIAVAIWANYLTIAHLCLAAFTEGTLAIFFSLGQSASLPRVVHKNQLPAAASQGEAIQAFVSMLGSPLGGLLFAFGQAIPFVADAISYLVSFVSLLFIRTKFQEEVKSARSARRILPEVGEGLVWLWRHPQLRFLAFLTGGLYLFSMGFILLILAIVKEHNWSNFTFGLILGTGGLGSILGSLIVGPLRKRYSTGKIMLWSTWIWALSWLLYPLATNVIILGIANAIGFIIVPIYLATQYSYRLGEIPDQLQGRVNSVFRLIIFGTQPISMLLTGFLLQAVGINKTILVIFLPQFLLAILALFNRHLRQAL